MLETIPMQGSLVDSVRKHISQMRTHVPPNDFVTVTIAERLSSRSILGSATAIRLKAALLFTPDVVVTDVPYIHGVLEHHQDALDTGEIVRHVVIVLVS